MKNYNILYEFIYKRVYLFFWKCTAMNVYNYNYETGFGFTKKKAQQKALYKHFGLK